MDSNTNKLFQYVIMVKYTNKLFGLLQQIIWFSNTSIDKNGGVFILGLAEIAHSIIAAVCSYLQDFAAGEQKLIISSARFVQSASGVFCRFFCEESYRGHNLKLSDRLCP